MEVVVGGRLIKQTPATPSFLVVSKDNGRPLLEINPGNKLEKRGIESPLGTFLTSSVSPCSDYAHGLAQPSSLFTSHEALESTDKCKWTSWWDFALSGPPSSGFCFSSSTFSSRSTAGTQQSAPDALCTLCAASNPMSCIPAPTRTLFTTIASTSTLTTLTNSVTSQPPVTTTIHTRLCSTTVLRSGVTTCIEQDVAEVSTIPGMSALVSLQPS